MSWGNSGYIGQSMSIRASIAYDNGEKPWSKWTKWEILDALKNDYDVPADKLAIIEKFRLDTLKGYFLYSSSWHHTGKYFNETNFYSISKDIVNNLDIDELVALNEEYKEDSRIKRAKKLEKVEKSEQGYKKAFIEYEELYKSGRYWNASKYKKYCLIKGCWAYFEHGFKKNINGSHILNITYFDRAPKGTAEKFKAIERNLKK